MNNETFSVNAEGIFEPFHISQLPVEEFSRGERFGMRFQHLSSFGGGSQIGVSMEVLPPGRQANQSHAGGGAPSWLQMSFTLPNGWRGSHNGGV